METEKGSCRGCGAEILWVLMPSGKRMPLDVGKTVIVAEVDGVVRTVSGHLSHFSTCPCAKDFQGGRRPWTSGT